jgi:hypothetical protein
MTVDEIQCAALGPYRWSKMVESHHKKHAGPRGASSTVPLKPFRKTDTSTNSVWRDLGHQFLVPGGRFAVTCDQKFLSLWDLGVVAKGRPLSPPALVSRAAYKYSGTGPPPEEDPTPNDDSNWWMYVCASGEDTLRVALVTCEYPWPWRFVCSFRD